MVEQHSRTDIRQSIEASVRTRRGARTGLPTFGITPQELRLGGADLARIEREVAEHEDRVEIAALRNGLLRDVVDEVSIMPRPEQSEEDDRP